VRPGALQRQGRNGLMGRLGTRLQMFRHHQTVLTQLLLFFGSLFMLFMLLY
jgi:hypothetical protein